MAAAARCTVRTPTLPPPGRGDRRLAFHAVDPDDPQSRRRLVIEPDEAEIVCEIFDRYADGMSPKAIANLLNERAVPSPGSSWKRTSRRTKGWVHTALVGTADRASGILRNELYVGQVVCSKRKSKKVPGTSRRMFEMRPRSEWITKEAPELRIVPDDVWERVQRRLVANRERARERKKSGHGYHVSRYLLSGLLVCGECGSNFIMADARCYRCSPHTNGGQHCCSNGQRVRRDVIEPIVLRGVKQDLLSEARSRRCAAPSRPRSEATKRSVRQRYERNAKSSRRLSA